jgi:uncharacterized protein (DUF1330 family)
MVEKSMPAHVIVQAEITDWERFKEYRRRLPARFARMEWYHSEKYQQVKKLREGAATGLLIAIEGIG